MVKSPCKNVCELDPKNDLCLECGRTLKEIATWTNLDDESKKNIIIKAKNRKFLFFK